ncbi:Asp-tRNA(Asn)/Glu-tRNA(Gln) amidotransferase subunit GatA [bacterium]|jgi:aspartyl-tRNA(Asn)/glutamyl-tRNA(Gln) amidotransferase subunit A|nr:Asp-tRNA(Asn)/Glu-tRNA(Gln) amidotransferase subunit GatA [bacterium]
MSNDTTFKTAIESHKAIQNGDITAVSLAEETFKTIDSSDKSIKGFLSLMKEQALETAQEVDDKVKNGETLPTLAGVPIAVKDNMNVLGTKTTCGSNYLKNFESPYDATVITKLKQNKLVMVGKTNMDEFAMGSSTENSAFFSTKNPWDLTRAPGGSSGGSAAVVGAGQLPLSLGSDTGGSIRQPASFCGICGLKPTYGRVSRYGLVAFASSLDQIGPFTRTAEDAAHLMNVISGHDPMDATSLQDHVALGSTKQKNLSSQAVEDFTSNLNNDINGLKIGVPKELLGDAIDSGVKEKIQDMLSWFEKQGATWEEISIDSFNYAIPAYYILAPAEASSNLARYDGVRYGHREGNESSLRDMYKNARGNGFGAEVKRRIVLGTYVLSSGYYDAYYIKAQKVRTVIKQEFEQTFAKYDIVLTPTSPTPPFKLGENVDDPLAMYLSDIATASANLAGCPALSIPCGFSDGLPVGAQFIGPNFSESKLLNIAHIYQQSTGFHKETPVR